MCADDYGFSAHVDEAILTLIAHQRLTATSCMTESPRWAESAARITSDIRSQADIGLHLDFTEFSTDYRFSLPQLIFKSYARRLDVQRIDLSIHRQLDAFESALNTLPDYVDGHQHVHQLPVIRDRLIHILHRRYATQKPWIRVANANLNQGAKAKVIGLLGSQALKALSHQCQLDHSTELLGIYNFIPENGLYPTLIGQWFEYARANNAHNKFVCMCHPAAPTSTTISTSVKPDDPIAAARTVEYSYLMSDEFLNVLKVLDIEICKFKALN